MLHNTLGNSIRRSQSVWIAVATVTILVVLLAITPGSGPAMAQTCGQLVLNPEFEEGTAGWETQSAAGSEIIIPEAAFHGAYGARLGSTNNADDRLSQWISFPPGPSSIGLTFFYRLETNDTSDPPADRFSVQFLDEQGQVLVDLAQLSNQNSRGQWFRRVRFFDAAEVNVLAGHRTRLQFHVTTNASVPTTFLVDDINLQVCTSGRPAVSRLRMSSTMQGPTRDHFLDGAEEIFISFSFENMGEGDDIRLLVRDATGTALLDHVYDSLAGSGTKQVVLTGRDAVDGLVRSGLDASNSVAHYSEQALQAGSRFQMAPCVEWAVVAATVLQNATQTLRQFQVGDDADAHLAQAQAHISAAIEAGQAALDPANDLGRAKTLVTTMRDEVQEAAVKVAEARSAVHSESLGFPDTFDCSFYLTNVYLNKAPVDSIEWTVGTPGSPARIHPPRDTRRFGVLHVQPLIIYTQGVTLSGVPHTTTIAGRVVDANCRPAADGTQVTLSLDDSSLGVLTPRTATTAAGYFTSTLQTTYNLGNGTITVRARAGAAEGAGTVFLVGPPAAITINPATSTIVIGDSTAIIVQVRDAQGQPVADGTEVTFRVLPSDAGIITPTRAITSGGLVSASFEAGDTTGRVAIHVAAGDAENVAVIQIAASASTATPTSTSTPTATQIPTPTATPTIAPTATPRSTATPACDSSDPEQLCNGVVSVRVFEDPRCDGQFNNGVDRGLFDIPVNIIYPDGASSRKTTDPNGYVVFGQVHLRGDERIALLIEYPGELVMTGLTPCGNSGTLKFVGRDNFGSFATVSVVFRAHRQIVTRRGILQVAEASLCFTAQYYLEPTDGGEVVYLVTDQDLSEYLDTEIEVTGSTWEIEFCRYLLPISINPIP